jgi:hypothetical protein
MNKSVLKAKLEVQCGEINKTLSSLMLMYGCALLWTVSAASVCDMLIRQRPTKQPDSSIAW